ncbi:hypothetical protein C8J56DRAFT_907679 [Mycena floridula]|nr:hypothetical protein C8J56DRAFT_907679 [Mycena floridula]
MSEIQVSLESLACPQALFHRQRSLAVRVLETVSAESSDFKLELKSHDFGGCAIAKHGLDEYIDTLLATPYGSLQWNVTDTSAIPASQLDEVSQPETSEPFIFPPGFLTTITTRSPWEFPVIDEEDEDSEELILPVAPQPAPRYHFCNRPPVLQSPTPKPPSSRSKFSVQSVQLGYPTVKVTNSRHKRSRGGVLSGEKGMII